MWSAEKVTPWLTLAIPTQPSKPERMVGLRRVLEQLSSLAWRPDLYTVTVLPSEGPQWTVGAKWRQAIAQCQTDWLYLLADDLHILTDEWDSILYGATFSPSTVLIHGYDRLFTEYLAAFPCLRTSFAQALLPNLTDYGHYKIDDHLFDVAKRMGGVRYLPTLEVIADEAFHGVPYVCEPIQAARDNAVYHDLEPQRAADAQRLKLTVSA